jgi:hypothetical protein
MNLENSTGLSFIYCGKIVSGDKFYENIYRVLERYRGDYILKKTTLNRKMYERFETQFLFLSRFKKLEIKSKNL